MTVATDTCGGPTEADHALVAVPGAARVASAAHCRQAKEQGEGQGVFVFVPCLSFCHRQSVVGS